MHHHLTKNLIRAVALSLVTVGFCGCQEEEAVNHSSTGVTFELQLGEDLGSRAFGDGALAKKLHYAAFKGNATTPEVANTETLSGQSSSISIPLTVGAEYKIVFWAQSPDATCYTFDPNSASVTIDYSNMAGSVDTPDAFFASKTFTVVSGQSVSVTLTRPLAQLNVGTSDMTASGITPSDLSTELSISVPNKLNLKDGTTSGDAEVTIKSTSIPQSETFLDKEGYNYLAMNYFLVPSEREMRSLSVDIKKGNASLRKVEVNNVSFQRNYRTNITGSLLTESTAFSIEIKPGFADSEIETPKVYDIASKADLLAVPKTLDGVTLNINKDIDLEGEIWTPINATNVTVNGNGKTISNYKLTSGGSNQGLFGVAQNVTVNKLSLANISQTERGINTGSNIGSLAGQFKGTVENVTVDHADLNGASNVGGVVGLMTTTGQPALVSYADAEGDSQIQLEKIFATVRVSNCVVEGVDAVGGFTGKLQESEASRAGEEMEVFVSQSGITNSTIRTVSESRISYVAGRVIGDLSTQICTVYYDTFTEDLEANISDLVFIGSNNAAWKKLGGSSTQPEQPEDPGEGYTKDGSIYNVTTFNGLRAAIGQCSGGETVKLVKDIDLKGAEIEPIKIENNPSSVVTIDGYDKTISNFTILPDGKRAGLFVHATEGTTLKNVNFCNLSLSNVTCVMSADVEINVSEEELICGALTDKYEGVITNVKVNKFSFTGAMIEGLPKGACGGLVGEFVPDTSEGSITGCTVNKLITKTCKIAGGLVGIISKDAPDDARLNFTNNTVTNCELNASSSTGFGIICGKYSGSKSNYITITNLNSNNNTCNNNTVKENYGH